MKDIYIYPAILSYADDGISVEFPDLDGAFTCGSTQTDAYHMAKDCLELHLYGMEEDGEIFPIPSKRNDIKLEENQVLLMIKVDMELVKDEMQNKTGKKVLC